MLLDCWCQCQACDCTYAVPNLFAHRAAQQCDAAGSYPLLQSGCQRCRLVLLIQHIAANHHLQVNMLPCPCSAQRFVPRTMTCQQQYQPYSPVIIAHEQQHSPNFHHIPAEDSQLPCTWYWASGGSCGGLAAAVSCSVPSTAVLLAVCVCCGTAPAPLLLPQEGTPWEAARALLQSRARTAMPSLWPRVTGCKSDYNNAGRLQTLHAASICCLQSAC